MITGTSTNDWQSRFVSMLPSIRRTAAFQLTGMTAEAREDALAEVIASCYAAYCRLVELGKESLAYPSVLAGFAVRQYRAGRRVGCKARRSDVYTQNCREKNGRELSYLGARWNDYLVDNSVSPVPDQVAFRIDFPEWLSTLTARARQIVDELVYGERVTDVSHRLGVSPGRVSQLRRELHDAWQKFQGEDVEPVMQGA